MCILHPLIGTYTHHIGHRRDYCFPALAQRELYFLGQTTSPTPAYINEECPECAGRRKEDESLELFGEAPTDSMKVGSNGKERNFVRTPPDSPPNTPPKIQRRSGSGSGSEQEMTEEEADESYEEDEEWQNSYPMMN